ncbi:putative cytochrome b5 [Atractiella rhizophila]|nr:putative cytochrome b5 [Atractiella rhizophila]
MSKKFTAKDVSTHTTANDAWLIIEGGVYDVSEFIEEHPGGSKILLRACGKDSTEAFWKFHSKKTFTKTAYRCPLTIAV